MEAARDARACSSSPASPSARATRCTTAQWSSGPRATSARYRKNHLWGAENLFFEPGNLGVPVFHIGAGRIACAICYDIWFPEIFRLAALQGADLLCVPTNWVPMPEQPDHLPVMANILAMGGAHSNSMFVAAADRVGVERGQPFLGNSLIVSHTGWPLAGRRASTAKRCCSPTSTCPTRGASAT